MAIWVVKFSREGDKIRFFGQGNQFILWMIMVSSCLKLGIINKVFYKLKLLKNVNNEKKSLLLKMILFNETNEIERFKSIFTFIIDFKSQISAFFWQLIKVEIFSEQRVVASYHTAKFAKILIFSTVHL